MAPHVAILVHEHGSLTDAGYYMRSIVERWKARGCRITIARGPRELPDADVGVLHVDLTRVDDSYLQAIKRCGRVINGAVADISKRHISRQLVLRGDDYDGPVIVKTNANHSGVKEVNMAVANGGLLGVWLRARNKLPWCFRTRLSFKDYRIFEYATKVPLPVWWNSDLVVERLITERKGAAFILRSWIFLGDREYAVEYEADGPVVVTRNISSFTIGASVPENLRQLRNQLGFDFGKFDFVQFDDKAVLFDANRTPVQSMLERAQGQSERLDLLAEGLDFFCEAKASESTAATLSSLDHSPAHSTFPIPHEDFIPQEQNQRRPA